MDTNVRNILDELYSNKFDAQDEAHKLRMVKDFPDDGGASFSAHRERVKSLDSVVEVYDRMINVVLVLAGVPAESVDESHGL